MRAESERASMPSSGGMLAGAAEVLTQVDELEGSATGALRFGGAGIVLVESRLVCWAVAVGMERRLTELLRAQRSPPIAEGLMEDLIEQCRVSGTPVGEALLSSGQVSEGGLRLALMRQTAEAIVHIAKSGVRCDGFLRHSRAGYDARFAFSTVEILARIGANRRRAVAAAARSRLEDVLVPDSCGFAFRCDASEALPVVLTTLRTSRLRVMDLVDVCAWVTHVFDVCARFDPDARVASASWRGASSVVAWRAEETRFVALCDSRAASAVIMARLSESPMGGRITA